MTFTYGGDPSANNRDFVRFKSGDTTDRALLTHTDEEIAGLLVLYPEKHAAAEAAILGLMGKAARIVSGGSQSPDRGSLINQLKMLLELVSSEAPVTEATAGGVELADKEAQEDDDTLVPQPFSVGQDDIQ